MCLKILALDDEKPALARLTRAILEAVPDADIHAFNRSSEAFTYINEKSYPDYIFMDIDMPGISGMEFAKKIKCINPNTMIVFVTGYSSYAAEAYAARANGYIMKPVTKEIISDEICYLDRYRNVSYEKPLRIQTFGNFDVFIEDKPVKFRYGKTKELLAWLIDRRGASSNTLELCAVLWEDAPISDSIKNQCRNLVSDLKHTFEKYGLDNILIRNGRDISVDISKIDCDLYKYLEGDQEAVNSFFGEYMSQFSWAELTLSSIEESSNKQQ